MANNRMFLVHRPTGRAIGLAKRMGWGWYVGNPANNNMAQRLTDYFDALEELDYEGLQDDFVLALEDVGEAPKAAELTRYGLRHEKGGLQIEIADPTAPPMVSFLARACMYAQSHVGDPDAWDHSRGNLENLLQCTSYQIACFLAQNTRRGSAGVEWEIVINELCDMPVKSEQWWEAKISKLVDDFGGLLDA